MTLVIMTPQSKEPFQNDWTSFLASSGQSVTSRQWTIVPDEGSMLIGDTSAICYVQGCLAGKDYVLKETITGDGAEPIIETRSFLLRCETNL